MTTIGRREFITQVAGGAATLALAGPFRAAQASSKQLDHRLFVITGKPRERGHEYGRRFKAAIHAFLEREIYRPFEKQPNTRESMLRFAAACGTAVREYSPLVHEEMEGIAEGTGLRLEEIVLINNHEELWHRGVIPASNHCTVFAAGPPDTLDGATFVAQTWDWNESLYGLSTMLHWKRDEGPSVLAYAYPGLWTGAGINDQGLALCWHTGTGDGTEPRVGIPSYALIAQILYQKTLPTALAELRRATNAGWFLFLVGDATGSFATVHGTPKGIEISEGVRSNGGAMRADGDAKIDLARMQAHCPAVKVATTIDSMVFDCAAKEAYVTRRAGGVTPWKKFTF